MPIDAIIAGCFGIYAISIVINLFNVPLFYRGTSKIVLAMVPVFNTIAAVIILTKSIYRGFKEIMED